jgi:general secretion pathway protein I
MRRRRRGITLYEVVIALVIFSGAIAAISEGVSTGVRAALQSRLQSQAILLCESKMGEVMGGVVPRSSTGETSFAEPQLQGWTWAVSVKPGPRTGLQAIQVDVAYKLAGDNVDATFSLSRLVRDQSAFVTSETAIIANNQAQALEAAQQAASTQSQTSQSSGSN